MCWRRGLGIMSCSMMRRIIGCSWRASAREKTPKLLNSLDNKKEKSLYESKLLRMKYTNIESRAAYDADPPFKGHLPRVAFYFSYDFLSQQTFDIRFDVRRTNVVYGLKLHELFVLFEQCPIRQHGHKAFAL